MTWEWSYTNETYSEIRDRIYELDRNTLEVVYAEQQATSYLDSEGDPTNSPQFDESHYEYFLKKSKTLASDTLAESIWEYTSLQRECSNGGHEVYLCPYHCHSIALS